MAGKWIGSSAVRAWRQYRGGTGFPSKDRSSISFPPRMRSTAARPNTPDSSMVSSSALGMSWTYAVDAAVLEGALARPAAASGLLDSRW
jgi:hypothetical protein